MNKDATISQSKEGDIITGAGYQRPQEQEAANTLLILEAKVERLEKLEKIIEKTQSLVIYGWIALLFVVIGILYGYWEFIFTSSKNEDYRYKISERIINNENEINNLKSCLIISKWLNPKCLDK